jgi:phage recombination protein Bet
MSTEVAQTNGQPRSLSAQLADRGITNAQWHTLTKSLYPGARQESALMVLDYCKARGLDPMKKACHIVPMEVKIGDSYQWRDVVLPGIYELRTTAHRTGQYLGHTKPEYGPPVEAFGVMAPEWCEMTMRRAAGLTGSQVAEFPVRVYFREVCGTKRDKQSGGFVANARWFKAPIQMLTKCTEGAGLREAFPDELGGQMAAEEADASGERVIDVTPQATGDAAKDLNADLGIESDQPPPVDPEFVGGYDKAVEG